MGLIMSYLKKYRTAAVAAFVMMLIELAVELSQPLLISKIIDDGIKDRDTSVVWMWGGILVGSAVVAFIAGILSSFFASHASQGFAFDLRDKLFERVQSFSYEVFNRFATSSLITRLTGDISQLQDTIFMSLRFMTRIPLVVIGSVVMALIVHVKLGLIVTLTVPVLALILYGVMKKSSVLFRIVQSRLDGVNGVIQENLTGIRLIRVFVRMAHEMARFAEFSKNLMSTTVKVLRLTETTTPIILLMMNAGILAVLWFGRLEISAGGATLGQAVAVVNYSLRTIGALSALSWIVVTFSRARASSQRIHEVFAEEAEVSASSAGADTAEKNVLINGDAASVEFECVDFRYPGSDISVLEDISFSALPGKRIAIMGATGSGKTSLVGLIPRLYETSGGVIRIGGEDIRQMDISRLRHAIGYIPQEVLLFTGTVSDNIAWGNEHATRAEIEEAAVAAQIHETILSLPNGYDSMLGQRGVNLSGGQKQRMTIARALVRKPSILILDDSTSALDAVTEGALLDALKKMSCTTFLITQKVSSTAAADLILLLDEGRLIGSGSHKELLEGSQLYRAICDSQAGKEVQHVQSFT
ncbi:ABC transporter ATP-binding protein [Paenibacillus sp. sgz500958]|uniref:ABC transporter ATP-binding protein n=1 Tax=Paenibacillus sp. sgz500958 TaxID=3242475 RepID=UPI0036D34BA5